MIIFDNVSFSYNNNQEIVSNINLQISERECLAIIGPNGVGKTTITKLMNGLLKPVSGNVYVDGLNTRNEKVSDLSKLVGLIFQNPEHMLFSETVYHEIEFGLKNSAMKKQEIPKKIEDTLEKFNLSQFSEKSPLRLSGGQKKMLSIACTDALNPKYLILDEPTIGQDAIQKEKITELIKTYMENNKSIIIITHDLDWVSQIATRTIILSNKGILTDGPPEYVLTNKEILELGGLPLPQVPLIARSLTKLSKNINKRIINLTDLKSEILKLRGES